MPVKCAECGFFTARHTQDGTLIEVAEDGRKFGNVPQIRGNFTLFTHSPICFVGACDLSKEAGTEERQSFARVANADRECGSFTPWKRGLTPREHQDMIDQKALRDWQDEQRRKDREWQDSVREKDRQWQLEQKAADRRWQVIMVFLSIVFGAIISGIGWLFQQLAGK